jgi:hypothetical protein
MGKFPDGPHHPEYRVRKVRGGLITLTVVNMAPGVSTAYKSFDQVIDFHADLLAHAKILPVGEKKPSLSVKSSWSHPASFHTHSHGARTNFQSYN